MFTDSLWVQIKQAIFSTPSQFKCNVFLCVLPDSGEHPGKKSCSAFSHNNSYCSLPIYYKPNLTHFHVLLTCTCVCVPHRKYHKKGRKCCSFYRKILETCGKVVVLVVVGRDVLQTFTNGFLSRLWFRSNYCCLFCLCHVIY